MASLLTSDEIVSFTGALMDHFDTFYRNIVVFKSPQKVIAANPGNTYPGYENTSTESDVQYVPVSGIYPALKVSISKMDKDETFESVPIGIANGEDYIKVKEDAKDFIENGKTENILIDGQYYNVIGTPKVKNYLGLVFYWFPIAKIV